MHQIYEEERIKLKKNDNDSNQSSYDSLASRINFWRDINTKNN